MLFSSHLLDEVERVADRVAIIDGGRIIQDDDLQALKANYHRLVLAFDAARETPPRVDGFFNWQGGSRNWSAFYRGPAGNLERESARLEARIVEQATPTLNEIFVALVGSRHPQAAEHA